jgi:hypothetical protein
MVRIECKALPQEGDAQFDIFWMALELNIRLNISRIVGRANRRLYLIQRHQMEGLAGFLNMRV